MSGTSSYVKKKTNNSNNTHPLFECYKLDGREGVRSTNDWNDIDSGRKPAH